ncbi:MAG: glycosyltransferase [Candidatus Babeliales bacterium]
MKKNNLISVVLGTYNRLDFLKLTVDSIRQELFDWNYETIIIDGGSDDGTIDWLIKQKDIITIVQYNRGEWQGKKIERRSWGYFMNLGFKCAQGKYICMLSDDCLVVPGAIKNGYNLFEKELENNKKIGAVAFYYRNWSKQEKYYVAYTLGNKMYVNHGLYLNSALKEIDYIDEDRYFFYNGDGDLCLKLWHKGYTAIDCPESFIEHYPHANLGVIKTNHKKQNQDNLNYFKKWENIFYDKKLNNLGMLKEKNFQDLSLTGEKFRNIHENIIKINPEVLINKKNKNIFFRIKNKFSRFFKFY